MATKKQSTLTQLAQEKTALDQVFLGRQSIAWLQENVRDLRTSPAKLAMEILAESRGGKFQMGGLYQFIYDPATKEKLPYYDTFPLVIPLHLKPGSSGEPGFLGLNLHYLPPLVRASFLDKLMDFAVLNSNDEPKRLMVTYDILKATERYKEFKPCIKHYLNKQVRSKMKAIKPNEWETAIYLPTANFQKATKPTVYKDSLNKISGRE
jgi:hypothetical protein